MKNVLVTGGAGFIGSHVVERLVAEGHHVVVVDDLSMGQRENLPDSSLVDFYEESITDCEFMEELLVKNDFDVIYLLAAIASVADTVARPYETHAVNQEANLFILKTLHEQGKTPNRIIFASSAAVYGPREGAPKVETDAVEPLTAYAIDKYATERFVLAYANLYNMNAVAVRFFNVYGPRQNPASPYSGVLSIIINALKQGKTFTLFGDGEQTRDFVYVKDVVAALKFSSRIKRLLGTCSMLQQEHHVRCWKQFLIAKKQQDVSWQLILRRCVKGILKSQQQILVVFVQWDTNQRMRLTKGFLNIGEKQNE